MTSEILKMMVIKSSKRNKFSWKNVLFALFIIPFVIIISVSGTYSFIALKNAYKMNLLNHLSEKDLTNIYTGNKGSFSFNYPKKGNILNWSAREENGLRVYSDGNNQGALCDIYVNNSQRNSFPENAEIVNIEGTDWKKWKDLDDTGSLFDSHFVSWYMESGNNHVLITGIIEEEGYCESIVSTFKFEK